MGSQTLSVEEFGIHYMRSGSHLSFIYNFTQDLGDGRVFILSVNECQHLWLWSWPDVFSKAGSTALQPKLICFLSEPHLFIYIMEIIVFIT